MSVTEEIGTKIEDFLCEKFNVDRTDPEFNRSVHLWEEGFVDSIGLVEVIFFIESEFTVKFPDAELANEERGSIEGLANLVHLLQTGEF